MCGTNVAGEDIYFHVSVFECCEVVTNRAVIVRSAVAELCSNTGIWIEIVTFFAIVHCTQKSPISDAV